VWSLVVRSGVFFWVAMLEVGDELRVPLPLPPSPLQILTPLPILRVSPNSGSPDLIHVL
jgi:hypothetical protein